VEEGQGILETLLRRYWAGLKKPLHLFPETSRRYAENRLARERPPEVALEEARKIWEGSEWMAGESQDPYYRLCFEREDPIDSAFEEVAVEVFDPLFNFLKVE
jgi:exodeoxyribonuclease V gamma subunit